MLAEVARTSLVLGTEFNRKPATVEDLRACCAAYQAQSDPELGTGKQGAIGHFLLRVAGQQLIFQQEFYNELARPVALFEQTSRGTAPRVATSGWPSRLLGCTLQEYVATAIMLYASALKNSGTFDPACLTQPQFEEATREVSAGVLRKALEDHYAASHSELRDLQRQAENLSGVPAPQYWRFGFNPLPARPAVAGLTDTMLIPVPALVVRKASALGIYYSALEKWG